MTDSELKVAINEILLTFGLNADEDENFAETPRRFIEYLEEFNQPSDLSDTLGTTFELPDVDTMVVQTDIPFRAVCAHHLLPFFGTASIGYIPSGRVVGLSKLTRLVQAAGVQRPSMQEVITNEITRVIDKTLKPRGVIVVTKAEHTCMAIRGIVAPGVTTTVSGVRGVFRDAPQTRDEFFNLIR